MPKVTVIFASPKKEGKTKYLLDRFLDYCPYEDIENVNIYEKNIAPCIDCGHCQGEKRCFNNDTDSIIEAVRAADFVIFASPIYNYSYPAPMKAFLDRLQPYFLRGIDNKERKGFVLVTSGSKGTHSDFIIEKQSRIAFSELSCQFCGLFLFNETDKRSTLHKEELCKVKLLAEEFFK